ncbi:MAG: aminotransferase class I/II-fold pyridoxal phosphate-dependent enzyme [bacterium]|nr:aminotransferase class I/II-fold pyridoxal phosphate-dependent enzyme [bacterium]
MKSGWPSRFSRAAARTHPPQISWLMAHALETPGLISLAAGFVDQQSLPHEAFSSELAALMAEPVQARAMLQYGSTQGDPGLRRALAERLAAEGVFHPGAGIDESHFIVGSGSQQILYLAAEAMLDEGDIVLLEAPTYFVVLGAFQTRGARTIGLDVDEGGLIPEQLEACLERLQNEGELGRVKMLYVMSYATNPQGVTLRAERRPRIIELLRAWREKGFPILLLEDAAYRRLSFEEPPAPLKQYDDRNDLVVYTESFSKSLSPGLRLGFGVGPKDVIAKMIDVKGNHDFGSSHFNQTLLRRVLTAGAFDRHVETLRGVYRRKCAAALEVLGETMPGEAHWTPPTGGFYIWVTLPPEMDAGPEGEVFRRAVEDKVLYVPGCLCYSPDRPESERSPCMRLSYGQISDDDLREGCRRLAAALSSLTHEAGRSA